jgi:peroxiredoxin
MNLKIGDKAPSFELMNSETQKVSLSDFQGHNLLILFFPLAFTSVCTTELCSVRDTLKDYEALDASVLGISVDSPFTLAKFKAEQNLNFPLLSDFNKEVSQAYGSFYKDFVLGLKGVSKRSAFVLDKNGVIQYAEVLESAGDIPNFATIKEALNALH